MEPYKIHKTELMEFWIDMHNIVHVTYFQKDNLSLEDAIQEIDSLYNTYGEAFPGIVDISTLKSVSRDARNYYASENLAKAYKCVALVTSSPVSKVIGNFFLQISKPKIPVRLVNSEKEGLEWLLKIRQN
ncbi:MAG: hypothetical protein JEZ03_16100 [Bacteroidales bacterium]|nr:hypothetical protein [Bacteroidales bacterium]